MGKPTQHKHNQEGFDLTPVKQSNQTGELEATLLFTTPPVGSTQQRGYNIRIISVRLLQSKGMNIFTQ